METLTVRFIFDDGGDKEVTRAVEEMAESSGMSVLEYSGPDPATEKELDLARSLGISLDEDSHDQLALVHMIAAALDDGLAKYDFSDVTTDNDNDSGELIFTWNEKVWVIRAEDIKPLKT
jgi:hypothetical protein